MSRNTSRTVFHFPDGTVGPGTWDPKEGRVIKSRAAYMRQYRAKRKAKLTPLTGDSAQDLTNVLGDAIETERDLIRAEARIRELEEEVARLKRELAARPTAPAFTNAIAGQPPERGVRSFSEFRPVPKPTRK